MPLLLLVPAIGAALWGGSALATAGTDAAHAVTGTPVPLNDTRAPWWVQYVLIGIAGLIAWHYIKKAL